ncbi:hypothetical protein QBC35DRAFT_484224 [Podospora australis]|uniref:Secreted protein n=1 Tax=Podospora australis TaxID=1536484 RepID=A0AAN7AMI3_9PEZI|nr:hypothetical protein QBC35DRAFT_484224 [Podospora australis]
MRCVPAQACLVLSVLVLICFASLMVKHTTVRRTSDLCLWSRFERSWPCHQCYKSSVGQYYSITSQPRCRQMRG